ncbi:hypothetical protein POM88_005189 [Heracleum sosnowskyi]|uniref:Defensin-like protein n=1 Tax=Heracleum sosnowskyi TaxID=360622 RepID=A0AAD8JLG0_9APIA|nr:hypothetical protein POM88_005189 [Heracleum sosnowskyi]
MKRGREARAILISSPLCAAVVHSPTRRKEHRNWVAKLHLDYGCSNTLTMNKVEGVAVCPDFITIGTCKLSDCNKICFDRHKQGGIGICVSQSDCSCFYNCGR